MSHLEFFPYNFFQNCETVCLVSTERSNHILPRWLVQGLKLYHTEVRPHFLPQSVPEEKISFTRSFPEQPIQVKTELFFVNSSGNTKFRVNRIAATVSDMVRFNF